MTMGIAMHQMVMAKRTAVMRAAGTMLFTSYSMSPSTLPFLALPPMTMGIAMHRMVWAIRAYVHMKKQFCAHVCGWPWTGSICNARIRAAMKRTANIGAKFIDNVAVSQASFNRCKNGLSRLIQSSTDLANWIAAYTRKYWHVRMQVHATAGDTGGTTSPGQMPFGGTYM